MFFVVQHKIEEVFPLGKGPGKSRTWKTFSFPQRAMSTHLSPSIFLGELPRRFPGLHTGTRHPALCGCTLSTVKSG